MEQQEQRLKLPRLMLFTGLAFMFGGFFRTLLEQSFLNKAPGVETTGLEIFLTIWLGFLIEAVVGMAVLAGLVRKSYSFRKLWLAGTGAFALGILIPALLINQFFYALLILPGVLVGLFLGLLLKERSGRGILILLVTIGFLICQVLVFSVRNDIPWVIWLYENVGDNSVTILMHMIQDIIIGAFVALGVGLMLRNLNKRE